MTCRGHGGIISATRRKFILAAETRTGHSDPNTTAYALYIWKTGQALRGGIDKCEFGIGWRKGRVPIYGRKA